MSEWFDDISRIVASPISRRRALKLIAGVLAGAALTPPGLGQKYTGRIFSLSAASAGRQGGPSAPQEDTRMAPSAKEPSSPLASRILANASNACDDCINNLPPRTDPAFASRCQDCCDACLPFVCTLLPGKWTEQCYTACLALQCPPWPTASRATAPQQTCPLYPGCGSEETCCNGSCVNLETDVNNCGSCSNQCTGTTPACCSGSCKDLASDNNNCGSCGNVCSGSTPYCVNGGCVECRTSADCSGDLVCDVHYNCVEEETAVTLASFTAAGHDGDVLLEWETASEIDTEGFNIWRSQAEDGQYTKLNEAMIPPQGSPVTGAGYTYIDTTVANGVTYFYKLEDVDIYGVSTFHGPVPATPARVFRTFVPLVVKGR